MNITKVMTADGKSIEVYPDAVSYRKDDYLYIFDASLAREDRDFSDSQGNWIAIFSGPVISWEYKQDDNNQGL